MPQTGMYRKILVPCADARSAEPAIAAALGLAMAMRGAVLVLHVVLPRDYLDYATKHQYDRPAPLPLEALTAFRRPFDTTMTRFHEINVQAELLLETGDPGSRICELARIEAVDLIVMSKRNLGFWEGLLKGSVSEYVLRNAPCSLLIAQSSEPLQEL